MAHELSRRARAWAAAAVIAACAGPAAAQSPPSPQSPGEADALFQQGRALYDAGKLEEACAKLGRSQALDPSVGTLGLLAACEEKRGLLAHAHADFAEAARLARAARDKRGAYAGERAAALLPTVPRLVIRVDPTSPPDRVTRAGEEVPPAQLGTEILVDPGRFEIVATAQGRAEFRRAVVAEPGQRIEIAIPAFSAVVASAAPPPPTEHPGLRVASFVVGGLGLVGLGVGAGFGARAIARNHDSSDATVCPPAAPTCAARSDAFAAATASTVGFIAGAAALGAGVVLFVVGRPTAAPPAAAIVVSPRGLITVTGSF